MILPLLTAHEYINSIHESSIVTLQALTLGLRAVHTAIARFDREIARTFTQYPDASLFAALPGSGTVYSARLLAAFGSRRERFESAEALLNFSGIAPVLKSQSADDDPVALLGGLVHLVKGAGPEAVAESIRWRIQ
jgi:hypothetical protein